MKILVSAFACAPHQGSECFVGWQAVTTIARDHEVWVLTSSRYEPDITAAREKGEVPGNVHFVFHGSHWRWSMNRMAARFQSWLEYLLWSRSLLPAARELHRQHKFNIIQHVTYISWRSGSQLWKLGVPFVWGPLGGAAMFPEEMMSFLSPATRRFERARNFLNIAGTLSPGVCACARNAAVVAVSNRETRDFLLPLRGERALVIASPTFFSNTKIDALRRAGEARVFEGPLRIFAGGNLEGRKGAALALEGLALVKAAGIQFEYRLGGGGPEWEHLHQLVARLGLAGSVIFGQSLSGEEYFNALGGSHIYLLPSFRESAPVTISEAMLAGCVPIVANASAQAEIVQDDCGFRVPVTTPEQMAREICNHIVELNGDRNLMRRLGQAAQKRAADLFSEEKYRASINEIYRIALSR